MDSTNINTLANDPSASSAIVTDALPKRYYVSTQRRYDNRRVRDSELEKRLCYECGQVLTNGEREYQDHILEHEAAYISYQLYHFENSAARRQDVVNNPSQSHQKPAKKSTIKKSEKLFKEPKKDGAGTKQKDKDATGTKQKGKDGMGPKIDRKSVLTEKKQP